MANSNREITITRTGTKVEDLVVGSFQKKGTVTAVLKQQVTKDYKYTGTQVSNDMQQNPFGAEEFNFEPSVYPGVPTTRVAWIDVPDTIKIEDVISKISGDACLYNVYSHSPIIHSNHQAAIDSGIMTKEDLAKSQAIRYGDGDKEGQLLLMHEKIQYKKTFFWASTKEDIDLRPTSEHYVCAEHNAELLEYAEMGISSDNTTDVSFNQEVIS